MRSATRAPCGSRRSAGRWYGESPSPSAASLEAPRLRSVRGRAGRPRARANRTARPAWRWSCASTSASTVPSIAHPFEPSYASAHQPSSTDRLRTPFSAAFIPLVPLASSGGRGRFTQTSHPATSGPATRGRSPRGTRPDLRPRVRASTGTSPGRSPSRHRRGDAPSPRTRTAPGSHRRAAGGRGRAEARGGRAACRFARRRAKPIVRRSGSKPWAAAST